MSSISEVDLAKEILLRAGFLVNRSLVVSSVENELFTIYSEFDGGVAAERVEEPVRYEKIIQIIVDLISNNSIYKPLYSAQTKAERAFLKKVTHGEDFYVKVNRGKGNDLCQYWHFNFPVNKTEDKTKWAALFSFTFRVGIRDTYPYEITSKKHLSEDMFDSLVRQLGS
jgi:hypothetical protein